MSELPEEVLRTRGLDVVAAEELVWTCRMQASPGEACLKNEGSAIKAGQESDHGRTRSRMRDEKDNVHGSKRKKVRREIAKRVS